MKFLYYDLIFLVAFGLFLIIFLSKRRKNLKREGILYLYRTKVGLRIIDYVGNKYKKILGILQYISITLGYILMVGVFYMLVRVVYTYLKFPEITDLIKAPPLVPLIPYFPKIFGVQSFFPPFYFTYFIISILIVATVHEFAHGIFAKSKGLRIKSTGFAFLGLLIGAFVEPDEKEMIKKSKVDQMSILSAGVFANVITAVVFIFIAWVFLTLAFVQAGAIFDNYAVVAINVSSITSIGDYNTENLNPEGILDLIENKKIEPSLFIPLNGESINLTEIRIDDEKYFVDVETFKSRLKTGGDFFAVYGDFPAIRAGLRGTIIEFDGVEIKNQEDLSQEISKCNPGDEVEIKTKFNNVTLSYNLQLVESPNQEGRAFLGISSSGFSKFNLVQGIIYRFFNFFEDPSIALEPKFNSNFVIFIKDLLWWIIIINVLVALFNMLPAGFLDGGRFFFLTVLALVKREKTAKRISKIIIYLILLIIFMIMASWLLALI